MSDKIPLPIELYAPFKSQLFILVGAIGMFWLGREVAHMAINDWFMFGVGIFLVIIGLLFGMIELIMLINPKPILTMTRYRLIYGHETFRKLFYLNRSFTFKEIRSIDLDYHVQKDMKHWYLNITLNTGKNYKLPLKPMKYENVMINEKEIFHLIEQVHQGQIPPTFVDFDMDIHDRMTGSGIFMMIFMGAMLVVAIFMGIK